MANRTASDSNMKHHKVRVREGVKTIAVPALDALNAVVHGFSTRIGGVSAEPFSAMNLALNLGEDNDRVEINRSLLAKALGAGNPGIYTIRQTHGTRIVQVDDPAIPAVEYRQAQGDALTTNLPGVAIGVLTADCVPVLLVDPVQRAVAAVHAGRQGSLLRILTHVVRRMQDAFGTEPRHLRAAVGPGIETRCYDIGETLARDVRERFPHAESFLQEAAGAHCLDLREMNHADLLSVGLREAHIYHVDLCTACETQTFYSYRRSRGKPTGRMMSLVMIKES